jgi:DNA-binding transcriptional regulator LsrR (DeoR family)
MESIDVYNYSCVEIYANDGIYRFDLDFSLSGFLLPDNVLRQIFFLLDGSDMETINELRLMTKAARLYFENDMRQSEIADRLGISQATVSRLINSARKEGIIRISVNIPKGVNTELEEQLIQKFGLKEAIVADCTNESEDDNQRILLREIGSAAAHYVETVIKNNDVVGISSWSETLVALVDMMQQVPGKSGVKIVQILGGVGNPTAEIHANRLTGRLASLVNGTPYFLPAPGIVGSQAAYNVIMNDKYVKETTEMFGDITMALVGIGPLQPARLLTSSGNIFSQEELKILRGVGATGNILLHFFDANGKQVDHAINSRVVSMGLDQLKQVDRAVAVAAGRDKHEAILAALKGKWINVLITDHVTADFLISSD